MGDQGDGPYSSGVSLDIHFCLSPAIRRKVAGRSGTDFCEVVNRFEKPHTIPTSNCPNMHTDYFCSAEVPATLSLHTSNPPTSATRKAIRM